MGIENCGKSLISLNACGVCVGCKKNISDVKKILAFYENKIEQGKTQKDLDNYLG